MRGVVMRVVLEWWMVGGGRVGVGEVGVGVRIEGLGF